LNYFRNYNFIYKVRGLIISAVRENVHVSLTKAYVKIEIYSSLPLDVPKDVAKVFHEYYLSEFFGEIGHFH